MGPMSMGGRAGGGPGGFTFNVGDMEGGLGDIFGNLFGRRGGRRAGCDRAGGRRVPARGAAPTSRRCSPSTSPTRCAASRPRCTSPPTRSAPPATAPAPSPARARGCARNCGGRGVVDDNQGMFSFSSPCRVCQGQGTVIDEPCPTCHGLGVEKRPREVQTRIPAGVKDGQTIRLKGRGGPGRNGGPNGDLLVELKVTPHRPVRPPRQRPHRHGAGHVRRGGARRRDRRADARRPARDAAAEAGHAERQPPSGEGPRASRPSRRPAT